MSCHSVKSSLFPELAAASNPLATALSASSYGSLELLPPIPEIKTSNPLITVCNCAPTEST